MRAFDRAVERFCYKHPRFGIRNLMLYIVIGSGAVYLLSMIDTTGTLYSLLTFSPSLILKGQIWRLVTFVFLPQWSNIFWTAIGLYFYYFIGSSLESQWGTARFNVYYLCGIVLSILYGLILSLFGVHVEWIISASYINMSLFFAAAVMWPDMRLLVFFIIPVKLKWLAIVDAGIFVASMIVGRTLFPLIAIGNFLLFFGYVLWERVFGKSASTSRTVQFKSAVRKAEKAEKAKGYRHKCSVCGKTDTDYPNLEFRYCSRCVGYHCFCEEHINNHIHFTE